MPSMRKISYENSKMNVQRGTGTSQTMGFAKTCAESAGSLLSRLQNNSTPSSSNEPDSPTQTLCSNVQPIPSLVGTSLDKQFELYNFIGHADKWKHFSAQSVGSSPKVRNTDLDKKFCYFLKYE